MRVLVSGGTGLIGRSTVLKLREHGHEVRIVSRGAENGDDPGISAWKASIADAASLNGCAATCDVVLHIAGIVAESPPDLTFDSVNVQGTSHIVEEATRSNTRRFVYLSSMGADFGQSEYHKSKLAAEKIVTTFPNEWVIARPGNVYGPGDEVLSKLVKYARALPAVPVIDDGDQPFQPLWHEDVADALVQIVEGRGNREIFELAGPDIVTVNSVFDVIAELTDREPARVSVGSTLVAWIASLAEKAGIEPPVHSDTLQMLLDGIYVKDGKRNSLPDLIANPTPIREGMRRLLHELPPQSIEDGYGKAKHRRVHVRIENPGMRAHNLFEAFVADHYRFLPVESGTEPNSPQRLTEDAVLPLTLPVVGNFSVRVEEAFNQAVTLSTLDGHPLAGFVRFTFKDEGNDVIFEVNVYDRPANAISSVGMALGGNWAQSRAWRQAAENVLAASGGTARDGVQHESYDLDDDEVAKVQQWFDELISHRRGTSSRSA